MSTTKKPATYEEMMAMNPYVVVISVYSGRAFALNRNYHLVVPLVCVHGREVAEIRKASVDTWNGWKPSWQVPDWAHDIPQDHFIAYWLS